MFFIYIASKVRLHKYFLASEFALVFRFMPEDMGILDHIRIFCVVLFWQKQAQCTNYLAFTNVLITRDQAQYCCAKYGLSLMSIDSQDEQTFTVDNLLPLVGNSGGYWLGVFSDNSTADVYNVKKQQFTWTNWDNSSFGPDNFGPNGSYVFNSTVCVKGDLSNKFAWRLANCNEKLPYVCEVTANDTEDMVDVGWQSYNCPILSKYKSIDVSRHGNIIQNGLAYSGTYGLFTKENKITEMGNQIAAYIVTNYHDCILFCLNNVQCFEIILVGNQACLLYSAV